MVTGGELSAGGIYNSGWNGDSTVQLANSIVAGNAADDCGGNAAITSLGHNPDGDNSCQLVAAGDLGWLGGSRSIAATTYSAFSAI